MSRLCGETQRRNVTPILKAVKTLTVIFFVKWDADCMPEFSNLQLYNTKKPRKTLSGLDNTKNYQMEVRLGGSKLLFPQWTKCSQIKSWVDSLMLINPNPIYSRSCYRLENQRYEER
jgi:hypothetical protein